MALSDTTGQAEMNPGNTHHIPFESLKSLLESYDYFIFGIYEQMREWIEKKPHLRRANVVIVSEKMIRKHSGYVNSVTRRS